MMWKNNRMWRFFICRSSRDETERRKIRRMRLPIYNRSGFQIKEKYSWKHAFNYTCPHPNSTEAKHTAIVSIQSTLIHTSKGNRIHFKWLHRWGTPKRYWIRYNWIKTYSHTKQQFANLSINSWYSGYRSALMFNQPFPRGAAFFVYMIWQYNRLWTTWFSTTRISS